MVRAAVVVATFVGAVALGACSGDSPEASSTTSAPSASATPGSSASSSAGPRTTLPGLVATPAPPPPPLPAGCAAPAADTRFSAGVATVEITAGPGRGRLDLAGQPRGRSEYRPSNMELKGEWEDAAGRLLYINFNGGDPCTANPSAFVRIQTEDLAFIDSDRSRCKVELKALSASGFDGSFTCTRLEGGNADAPIDASGTFSARP